MAPLVCALLAAFVTLLLLPLAAHIRQGPNFRGRMVGKGGGLAVVAGAAAGWLAYWFWQGGGQELALLLFGVLVMAGLGLVDDCWGQEQVKGLGGHLGQWWQGGGDTALVKAAGALVVGLVTVSVMKAVWWEMLLDVLTISLAANALNLLDLRPGRALKGFMIGLLFIGAGTAGFPYLLPLLGPVLAYAPFDFGERLMLGDTGANALGAALGVVAAMTLSWPVETGLVTGLAALHWYTERGSISGLIERVGWLAFLDRLGRRI